MRRRIRGAIVGVSAIILLALGVPLAVVVHRSVVDAEVVELQVSAATVLAEIEIPISEEQLAEFTSEPDAPARFGVYDVTGTRMFGRGPRTADRVVSEALDGTSATSVDGEIVVATPIVEPGTERVLGVLRMSESMAGADQRARRAWLIMGSAGVAALGLAWLIGNRLARILADPLSDLAATAASIGEGAGIEAGPSSGIDEIDGLAAVLALRARKVFEALQREQQFSADVSHQLRTPLTALRLKLDGNVDQRLEGAALDAAIADVDRLEVTIEHLLAVARDAVPTAGVIALDVAAGDAAERWAQRLGMVERSVTVVGSEPVMVRANRASVDEVLDVLIDNGLRHGVGAIEIRLRRVTGGIAVDVSDEGSSISLLEADRVFTRRHGSGDGEGIGLAVARSIAEAEGGRLLLTGHRPTTFSLLLIEDPPAGSAPQLRSRSRRLLGHQPG